MNDRDHTPAEAIKRLRKIRPGCDFSFKVHRDGYIHLKVAGYWFRPQIVEYSFRECIDEYLHRTKRERRRPR